ncbi:MAG: hypothetical protein JO323_04960 [Acidobacteriia bacterium]|nr:hypothetical protein [Terriglobia bacterium]
MLRRLGISTLALGAILAAAAPNLMQARDRYDHRGFDHHEVIRGRDVHDRDRGGWNFGVGVYAAPAHVAVPAPVAAPVPVTSGYYDRFGVWHPYTAYYGY